MDRRVILMAAQTSSLLLMVPFIVDQRNIQQKMLHELQNLRYFNLANRKEPSSVTSHSNSQNHNTGHR
jgi:hypothetical protein